MNICGLKVRNMQQIILRKSGWPLIIYFRVICHVFVKINVLPVWNNKLGTHI